MTRHEKTERVMENAAKIALDQYLARIQALLTDCEKWSTGLGLKVTHGETAINEERHGQYQAPTLILDDSHGKNVAEILPFGASILGAWGRVDVVGEYGKREKIIYLSAGGPTMATRIQVGDGGEIEPPSKPNPSAGCRWARGLTCMWASLTRDIKDTYVNYAHVNYEIAEEALAA
jgi:hypothetical protein